MPRFTPQQYSDWLAKEEYRKQRDGMVGKTDGVKNEKDLHAEILRECRNRGWIAFHGSMAHSTFRTLGEPDFVILGERGRVVLVECKTKKGKLSPDQAAIAHWAENLGHKIHVVRSLKEFMELF